MPKVKPHSGAEKSFSLTGTGKIKRAHAFKNHELDKKTTKQKRRLTHKALAHKADEPRVKKMLNV